ncbi:hypothetical protein B0H10DRAFT_1366269 [Mycena sp. CBHHK59/15]|nr:hypothetical protein B0H10DRAFT_1366269 [Mycena sp. CBHHK59/15]
MSGQYPGVASSLTLRSMVGVSINLGAADNFALLFSTNILAAVFLGGLCTQTWTYFVEFPKDALHQKTLVAFVFLTNILHQIFLSNTLYDILTTTPIAHYPFPRTQIAIQFLGGCTGLAVQVFYEVRIYKLSKKWYISGALFLISLAQFGLNIVTVIVQSRFKLLEELVTSEVYVIAFNALGAAVDILIAVCMVYVLLHSRTGVRKTNNILVKLTLYCVNSGLVTCVFALGAIITLALQPDSSISTLFSYSLGRVYGISLMGILNARTALRLINDTTGELISLSLQSNPFPRQNLSTTDSSVRLYATIHDTIMDELHVLSRTSGGLSCISVKVCIKIVISPMALLGNLSLGLMGNPQPYE